MDFIQQAAIIQTSFAEKSEISTSPEFVDIFLNKEDKITIQPRPFYCNRGRFQVNVFSNPGKYYVDIQDGFPRYYFDFQAMISEIKAWIDFRNGKV